MKGIVILIVIIIIIALALGFMGLTSTYDCKDDMNCFKEHAADCRRAVFSNTTQMNGALTMTMKAEIRGGSEDSCEFYLIIEDITISDSLTPEEREIAENMFGRLKGKDVTCFPTTDVLAKEGIPNIVDPASKCIGPLLDSFGVIEDYT